MNASQFTLTHRGEENSHLPRWTLLLVDESHPHFPSHASLDLTWSTREDGKWSERNALHRRISLNLGNDEIGSLINAAVALAIQYPGECLSDHQVHTHGGHSPTRSNDSKVICRSISFVAENRYQHGFYIRTDSPVWGNSSWGSRILELVQPHLIEAPWRTHRRPRNLP